MKEIEPPFNIKGTVSVSKGYFIQKRSYQNHNGTLYTFDGSRMRENV